MTTLAPESSTDLADLRLNQVRAKLQRLEGRDWWLLGMAILVTFLLMAPVFSLSLPELLREPDALFRLQVSRSLHGLLGIVLLFNTYVVYQHARIKRLRRELEDNFYTIAKLEVHAQDFQRMALLDPLTDLYNRRFLERHLVEEMARARRDGKPLTVVMLDLDKFKPINDRYGHLAGDLVLKEFTQRLKKAIRGSDLPVRIGGDEFMVLLPECSSEQVRNLVARLSPFDVEVTKDRILVSFSVGWAEYEPDEPPLQLLERADQALYAAKRNAADVQAP